MQNLELELQYKTSYARIQDAKRRFLEAATRYYELSQASASLQVDGKTLVRPSAFFDRRQPVQVVSSSCRGRGKLIGQCSLALFAWAGRYGSGQGDGKWLALMLSCGVQCTQSPSAPSLSIAARPILCLPSSSCASHHSPNSSAHTVVLGLEASDLALACQVCKHHCVRWGRMT